VFERFREGIEPLRRAGKLGGVLLQFPHWFSAADDASFERGLAYLDAARDRLEGYRLFVEFREPSWIGAARRSETTSFLIDRDMTFVCVDAPQTGDGTAMPPVVEATTDWACVRLHGRNVETWSTRTESAADRFDYLYSERELNEWEEPVRRLAGETDTTFVLFNNNKYDYAQRNAAQMSEILEDLLLPIPHGEDEPKQEKLF
jgi:uncharacterized protein YecE (DUF72 family)